MKDDKIVFDITTKKMLYDNVLITVVDTKTEDDPLMDINQYSDKPEIGKVVSCGPGRINRDGVLIPIAVSVGDIVLFNKYSSVRYRNPVTHEDFYVIREEDIVCH